MNIPPGRIFNTSNINSALNLLTHSKIVIISSRNEDITIGRSPQCPQRLQSESCKGFPATDIERQKSAMSADGEGDSPPCTSSQVSDGEQEWDHEMQRHIEWFKAAPRITRPFHLEKHLYVCMPEKYYESLDRSIQTGPSGPRGKHGALMADLRRLREVSDGSENL